MYVYNELVEFILWKEGFNSDGHQFHQYQQTIKIELTGHKKDHDKQYDVGNPLLIY
jgi:hypothetical protein